MLQLVKKWWLVVVLAANVQSAGAFSLLGSFDTVFQVSALGYGAPLYGDIGGPMNLGEEFRYNTPVVFYAFDDSFLQYFGSNGVAAIDQAMAVFNNLNDVSSYTTELSEFPYETKRVNFRAEALSVYDLKSLTMELLMEHLGAAQPERFTWTLRVRVLPAGAQCPAYTYIVIKRNFDPVTWEPTSYVNGALYTYQILEYCPGPPNVADAFEVQVDPLADGFSAVAGLNATVGQFYIGLTRDDIGSLRYMLRTNNVNLELPPPNSVQLSGFVGSIDTSTPLLLVSSNLALLSQQALLNNAAGLQALYPDLVISTSTLIGFSNVPVANVFAYLSNSPYSPAGQIAVRLGTNYTTNFVPLFRHTFANVITNQYYTTATVTALTTNVLPNPYAVAGTVSSQISASTSTFTTNLVGGDFFIIPTNLCGLSIQYTQAVLVVTLTNVVTSTIDVSAVTNAPALQLSTTTLTYFTNHVVVAFPVICAGGTNAATALRQGIERVRFVRRDYDSLQSQFYAPFTTNFTMYGVGNNERVLQEFTRTVTTPDIVFQARDGISGGEVNPITIGIAFRTNNFSAINGGVPNGLAGPGTIFTPVTFTFNKVGPYIVNTGPFFITEETGTPGVLLGSFDGSTNPPVLYPSGRSIMDLENQILMQITNNRDLPTGTNGVPYSVQLGGLGGQPPYQFSLAATSPGLPPGLTFTQSNGNWFISGTPTQADTFDFTLKMTDFGGRSVTRPFTITIDP